MSSKGPSNLYGNSKGSKRGHETKHTGFAWAKGFNSSTLADHFRRHGKQMGCDTKESYAASAVRFANTVNRKDCISYKDKRGTTYKYNTKTNTFAIITKKGIVITYFKPSDGKAYYNKVVKGAKKHGK